MSTRDDVIDREQAWRAKQGPGVAMRYKFHAPTDDPGYRRGCSALEPLHCSDEAHAAERASGANAAPVLFACSETAVWKVARSPYSVTGVRYYCDAHCPHVPEGTP